jgi:hypothetical protein
MLNVIMPSVVHDECRIFIVMLSVVFPSDIMPSVVAPPHSAIFHFA